MGNCLPHIERKTANKNLRIHCQDSIYGFHQKKMARPFWDLQNGDRHLLDQKPSAVDFYILSTLNIIATGFVYYHYISVYYMLYIYVHLPSFTIPTLSIPNIPNLPANPKICEAGPASFEVSSWRWSHFPQQEGPGCFESHTWDVFCIFWGDHVGEF